MERDFKNRENGEQESLRIYGRNSVLEAVRSDRPIEKIYIQEHLKSGPIDGIIKNAKEKKILIRFEKKEVLTKIAGTENHQGVVCDLSACRYYEIEDILHDAEEKGEDPFVLVLDNIEDPHNLGAIIRTAHQAGAHGIIIPKNRAVGMTGTVVKSSAGAFHYMKVAKVTNIKTAIQELKERGLWFVVADMDGTLMYDLNLKGPIGLVIGAEGKGVSKTVKDQCDFVATIPMKGKIDSLNASVAAGILSYEIVRQRLTK